MGDGRMMLQFTVISYLIIAGFYAVSAVGLAYLWWLFRAWAGTKKLISTLAVILLVLPWADEVWIAWNFKNACEGAGIHVVRKVEAEGFYDSTMRSGYSIVERRGFKFMEHKSKTPDKIDRVYKVGGEWRKETLDAPSSRFHLLRPHEHSEVGGGLTKFENVIWDNQEQMVLGRDTSVSRYPSFIDQLWMGFFGSGQVTCSAPLGQRNKKRIGRIHTYVINPLHHGDGQ